MHGSSNKVVLYTANVAVFLSLQEEMLSLGGKKGNIAIFGNVVHEL